MVLMMGVVLLICLSLGTTGLFPHFSHEFLKDDAFWLLTLSIVSSWIDFLHDLVECPDGEWYKGSLIQRRTQGSPGLCHYHSSDLALEVCVSSLCLKRPREQKSLPGRSPGYALLAGMESSCCLSSSHWNFMTLSPSLPTERCQRQSRFCRGLLLWNLWPPSLLILALVKLQRVRDCAQQSSDWKNHSDCTVAF